MDALEVSLGVYTTGSTTAPGSAHLDNLNGGGPSGEGWCSASTIADDFDDGTRSHTWVSTYGGDFCTPTETGGQLVLAHTGEGYRECAYASGPAYDLTGTSVLVEVPAVTTGEDDYYAFLSLTAQPGSSLDLYVVRSGGELALGAGYHSNEAMVEMGRVAYSTTAHRWWRIREQGGTTHWETSPDAVSWTEQATLPNPIAVVGVNVNLGVGFDAAGTQGATVAFDNLNVTP
jgi:hypothetical protein